MIATAAVGLAAGLGAHWLYTASSFGWTGFGLGPKATQPDAQPRPGVDDWLAQAGLDNVSKKQFFSATAALSTAAGLGGFAVFGGLATAGLVAAFAASFPVVGYRARRKARRQQAQEAWPRMIDEIRVQASSLGRSVPQALFDVGLRGPEALRPGFEAAHREWLLTTDLESTLKVLKQALADPTADAACETLLIAHELGGSDLDRRLQALAEDRRQDVQGRKDALSRQAGARFARLFVLIVPVGMALAGMSIGNGRDAYRTSAGQAVVLLALLMIIACWLWAGRVMRLPEPERVFDR